MTPSAAPPYLDPQRSFEERARDLRSRLTLEEKVSQLLSNSPAIERLGVPAHHWWNEGLHGVARAGIATVFPQAIGLAATFDPELHGRVATAISDEARAKHHEAERAGLRGQYVGLSCWSPNVNLFRDPRWGRGQETYGEDPLLSGRLGVAFVRGLQGDHPRYLKLAATPKHFAVHSGPERLRHRFDARPSARDLKESYLPQFERVVKQARPASIMAAYNRLEGEPCCSHPGLLGELLRGAWGFPGYVTSDCGAVDDLFQGHQVAKTPAQAAARALRAGCDLECGGIYRRLPEAVQAGQVSVEEIDRALERILAARMRLGVFDPPERVPWARISPAVVDCPEHRALALEAARKSLVLLRNDLGLLPLDGRPRRLAVIGPSADALEVLLGNYHGTPSHPVTLLAGLREGAPAGCQVAYAPGCDLVAPDRSGFAQAVAAARESDLAIVALGLSPRLEGEEGDAALACGTGDREELWLPGVQEALLEAVASAGKPLVAVLTGGSPLALRRPELAPTLLMAWYPGQAGGTALADVLFGRCNPSGRLPVTFPRCAEDLPPFEDYAMSGRTYRFLERPPAFPFGHGLSYTRFRYRDLRLPAALQAGEPLRLSLQVENLGSRFGEEVVQLYLSHARPPVPAPRRTLGAFARVALAPGACARVELEVEPVQLAVVDEQGRRFVPPGALEVAVGGGQPDAQGCYRGETPGCTGRLPLLGPACDV